MTNERDTLEVVDPLTGTNYRLDGTRGGAYFAARMPGRFKRQGPTGAIVPTVANAAVFHESGFGLASFLEFDDALIAADELSRYMPADFDPKTWKIERLRAEHPELGEWLRDIDKAGKAIPVRTWCNRNAKKTPAMVGIGDVNAELEAARRNLP